MLSRGYHMLEMPDVLLFQWMSPSLPAFAWGACLALLILLPVLWVFRRPASAFAVRHLHLPFLTPRALGLLAPALSMAAGALVFFFASSRPVIEWRLTKDGVVLKSLNGETSLRWTEVDSAAFDTRSPKPEETALILKTKDGREAWFILSWLHPAHREKLLTSINARAPGKLGRPAAK